MCCLSGSGLWTGLLESVFAVSKASSPLAVSVTQLVSMSREPFELRFKTQMISHSFPQGQGGTIFSCVTQHPGEVSWLDDLKERTKSQMMKKDFFHLAKSNLSS